MARAQAQLVRVGDISPGFQSFWLNTTGRVQETDGNYLYRFMPFETGVITTTNTGDNQTLSVSLPATAEMVSLVDQSIAQRLAWVVTILGFEALTHQAPGLPIPGETLNGKQVHQIGAIGSEFDLMARFYGEVIGGSSDMTTLTVELGSSLSPVGAQVPPSKFTTTRVGAPLRL